MNDKLPKLTNVLAKMFSKVKFLKTLAQYNANSKSKVHYSALTLMSSLIKFVDKVMKMGENGYQGYKYKVEQVDASGVSVKKAANEEEKIPVVLQFEVENLDWPAIKKEESADVFAKYRGVLGIFIVLTNKENEMTQIFSVDVMKAL